MRNQTGRFCLAAGIVALLTVFAPNYAKAQSFSGDFIGDDGVAFFTFTTTGTPIDIRTTSYAAGGFDPLLSLFDSAGLLLAVNDDRSSSDPDSELALSLTPGDYIFTVSQYENQARGPRLSDGFLYQGVPDYTNQFALPGGPAAPFVNVDGDKRTGSWAVTVTGVSSAATVPEPTSVAFAVGTLMVFGSAWLRRRQ